jgi:hypothetical protein
VFYIVLCAFRAAVYFVLLVAFFFSKVYDFVFEQPLPSVLDRIKTGMSFGVFISYTAIFFVVLE